MVNVILIRILAVIAVLSALLAITRRNPVYSALYLIMNFIALGGIFALYISPFLGAIQIIVYAGAILVLFVMAIMVLNLREEDLGPPRRTVVKFLGVLAAFGFIWLMAGVTAIVSGKSPRTHAHFTGADVGQVFMTRYVVAFEVVSVLLILGALGALYFARRKVEV